MLRARRIAAVFSGFVVGISGCVSAPALRASDEFPRAQVMSKIQCELVYAVRAIANLKSSDEKYKNANDTFDIPEYTASITLTERADRFLAAQAGGSARNRLVDNDHNAVAGGSGSLPGFGARNTSYREIQSKRVIEFSAFLHKVPGPIQSFSFPKSDFYEGCNNGPGANPSKSKLAIGENLGIAERLKITLDDAAINPATVEQEQMIIDFKVEVDASGTVSLFKPYHDLSIGAGITKSYDESVTILIVRNAKNT
ncbi:hypothetical protein [Rhizobium laguerreae]|uniref:hypothetical protein n=1 Tax=Rhizobium laguerreae TaxID=1076926 RepID=UPI001C8FAFED|nr:hypothetical protein [Rhizobium laguerreae]MBY3389178.1 hypothetical protein [Rhizobium laguerreae]MBY3402929.1 hypothetical protein [Rhizobium laguerreae]MBY3409868.1 hypothetical protein [Rhizobium laguerreae]